MTPLDLLIDTETTGLPRKGLPLDDPSQPRILELSARLVDDEFKTVASFSSIIRPDGWAIEPGAQRVHGINEARAYQVGIPITAALVVLQAFTEKARRIVAHNMEFERTLISSELARLRAGGRWWNGRVRDMCCTMLAASEVMKIPGDFGEYRWPKLDAAHSFFYPEEAWTSTHRADHDLEACLRVWQALCARAA